MIITLIVIAGLSLGVNFILSSRKAKAELEKKVEEYIFSLTDTLRVPLWDFAEDTIEAIGASYGQNEFVAQLLIEGQDGFVFYKKELSGEPPAVARSSEILYEDKVIGRVTIGLGSGYYTSINRQLFWSFSIMIFIISGALLVMTGVLLHELLKKPLSRFIDLVNAYAAGDSHAFKHGIPYTEFVPLIKVLDKMGGRIESHIRSLKLVQYAVDSSSVATYWIDPDARITYINEAASRSLGYSKDELVKLSIADIDLLWPADLWQERFEEIKSKGSLTFESVHRRKDGTTLPVEVMATFLMFNDVEYLFAFVADITHRKRAEEKYRQIFEHAVEGIYQTTPEGQFISANPAMARFLGYDSPQELMDEISDIGKQLYVSQEDRNEFIRLIEEDQVVSDFEARFHRKDGRHIWVSFNARPVYDDNGSLTLIEGFMTDITERKRAEEELQKLNEDLEERVKERTAEFKKLSEAVTQSPASVVITDKDGTIEYVNPRFSKVTGYTAKEAVGDNPRVLKSGNLPKAYYKDLWDTILSGSTWRGEFINRKKNGEDFWESASISPIKNDAGEITHFVAVKQDITEKKYMEEQLIQAKRAADEANKAKGEFLANMSHEVRTPMNAVIGMTHLALQTDLTIKQRDYLTKIQSSANSLLGIINDILDFSKIEAGKLDMESVEFNLDHVLDNLANLITVKAQEKKDLEILFAMSHRVPRFLVGDALRLGQVLINLANNAVKFTDSGEIVVSTKLDKKDEDRVTLKFSVRDTGIGLTEDLIDKLFEAFSQADTSTTRKYGGTGLGLNISKLLVEMMGGKIWVESDPGRGSTFHFTANFGLKKEKGQKCLRVSTDLRGKKILVVDDNATSRKILQEILHSFSFEVSLAASGEEGLAELESAPKDRPYDLVIMDWKMPGMDGLEASRRIKNHTELGRIPPIILVTAYGREEIMQQAEQLRLEGFLLKPVSQSALFDAIIQAMGHEVRKVSHVDRKKEDRAEDLKAICGARVLLVEDNEINQQVAREILEGAGLNVTLANDGQEAVEAAKKYKYDAILMDIQMPVMDGDTATRKIREWEQKIREQMTGERGQTTEDRRQRAEFGVGNKIGEDSDLESEIKGVPIIAISAHAMAGDDDKSLLAGMNGHVTKPIDPDQLFAALLKWIRPSEKRTHLQPPKVSAELPDTENPVLDEAELPGALPGFDLEAGLKRLQGNRRLYRKLLLDFGANYTETAGKIRQALDANDFDQAHRLVHNIKGLAGNLAATDLQAAAVEMEKHVKGKPEQAPSGQEFKQKYADLDHALTRALESVQTLHPPAVAGDENAQLSPQAIVTKSPEISKDDAGRILTAAGKGDIEELTAIAEELKERSDAYTPFSEKLVELAEDFDFEVIEELVSGQ